MRGSVLSYDIYVTLIRHYCDARTAYHLSNTCKKLRCALNETERKRLIIGIPLWNVYAMHTLKDFKKCHACGEFFLKHHSKKHTCRLVEWGVLGEKVCSKCCTVYSKRSGYHELGKCMYKTKPGPAKACMTCGKLVSEQKGHQCDASTQKCRVCENPYAQKWKNCVSCEKKKRLVKKKCYYSYPISLYRTIFETGMPPIGHLINSMPTFIEYAYQEDVILIMHGFGNFEWIGECIPPHCGWCSRRCSGQMCGRCNHKRYCSKQCQVNDWNFHKYECLS